MVVVVIEIIRIVIVGIIFLNFIAASNRKDIRQQPGWNCLLIGFGLIMFAVLIDLTDNFPVLDKLVVIGDTAAQAFLEKIVGYLMGFTFLAIGFKRWLPVIVELKETERKLKTSNEALGQEINDRQETQKALKIAKEGLERQYEELKTLDRMKDGLLSDVTHELKTPVAKQVMQLELLKRRLKEKALFADFGNIITTMESSIERQGRVINNILDLSSLEKGGREYKLEPVRLDSVVQETLDDYHFTIESHGVTVDTALPPTTIVSDQKMLFHVFANLINNAIKYKSQSQSPKLEVSLEDSSEKVIVKISDNGIGLSEAEKDRVFERFFQASASAPGSGVGLAIAKRIVEDLKGRIWLESLGKDQGTTAVVELPVSR